MKNLWKKTSKTYKIIALVISIVMVLTPIYIHLDRRYNSKAEEPIIGAIAINDDFFTSYELNCADNIFTLKNNEKSPYMGVYTSTDFVSLSAVDSILLSKFPNKIGTDDYETLELSYKDSEGTVISDLTKISISEINQISIYGTLVNGALKSSECYVATIGLAKDTVNNFSASWKKDGATTASDSFYTTSGLSVGQDGFTAMSGDGILELTQVKYSIASEISDTSLTYDAYKANLDGWSSNPTMPDASGNYIVFAGLFYNDSLLKASSGAKIQIDLTGPTVNSCNLKKDSNVWDNDNWINKEFSEKNNWKYELDATDVSSKVNKAYFKWGTHTVDFEKNGEALTCTLASLLDADIDYSTAELIVEDSLGNSTTYSDFTKVKFDSVAPVITKLEISNEKKHGTDTYYNGDDVLTYEVDENNFSKIEFYNAIDSKSIQSSQGDENKSGNFKLKDRLLEDNTYELYVKAYDQAGNFTSNIEDKIVFKYDATAPIIGDFILEIQDKDGEWVKEDATSLNPTDSRKFRFSFNVSDANLDEDSIKIQLRPQDTSLSNIDWTVSKDGDKFVHEFMASDVTIGKYAIAAIAKDYADNERNQTIIETFGISNPCLEIKNPLLIIDGKSELLPDTGENYFNKKVELSFGVESGFAIKTIDLVNESEVLASATDLDKIIVRPDGKYLYTAKFTVPKEFTKNIKYSSLKVIATDENPDPGSAKVEKNIMTLFFDKTKPTVAISNDPDEIWYSNVNDPSKPAYTLIYGVDCKNEEIETDFASTSATADGKTCDVNVITENKEFSFDIPESKTLGGTKVVIYAKDKAGNLNDIDQTTRFIKVDNTKPIINNVKIGGYTKDGINRASGDFKIDFDVTDNLTYDRVKVVIYKGTEKVTEGEFTFPDIQSGELSIKMSDVLKNGNKKLEDGTYKMGVIAYDRADNASEEYTKTFTLDNKAPELALEVSGDSTYNNSYYRKQVVVTATAKDDGIDGDNLILADNGKEIKDINWQKNGSKLTATFKISEADYHHITLDGSDLANNKGITAEAKFVIDKKNPEVTSLTVNGKVVDGDIITGTPEIRVEVKDDFALKCYKIKVITPDGTSVVRPPVNFHGKIDKKNMTKKYTYELPELISDKASDGKYKIAIDLEDMAGHTIRTTPVSFTLDNTKPVFDIQVDKGNSAKKNTYYNSDVTVKYICWDNNFDKNYMIPVDNNEQVSVEWIKENGAHVAYYTTGSEGYHLLTINGTDAVMKKGNEQQKSFVIDKNAPTIDVLLNGGQIYNESMGSVNMTGPAVVTATVKDAYVDNDDFLCQVIKAAPDQPVVNGSFVKTKERTFTFEEEADYTVNFQTRDLANNESKGRSVKFRVDKTAPELSCTAGANGTATAATTVSFTMKEAFWSDASGKIDIYRKGGDGQAESLYKTIEIKPTGQTTSISESFSETGVYRFELEAKDFVGHSATLSQSLTLDTSKPVIKITGVNNYDKLNKAVDFSATIEEEFFASKVVKVEGYRVDEDGKKNKIDFSYAPAAPVTSIINNFKEDGIYTIKIEATDPAGNKESQEVTFTIDTSKPKINNSLISGLKNSINKFALKLDAEDLVTDLTVCDVHLFLNGSEFDGESDIEDGHYVLRLTAKDELGNSIDEEIADFTLDTKAPVIIITGVEDGEVKDEAYSINVSLQIAEDTLESVTLNNKEMAINNNTCQIDIADKGDYVLEVNAIDDAGNKVNQVLKFEYGSKSSLLWILLISAAVLLILGVTVTIIVKNKK